MLKVQSINRVFKYKGDKLVDIGSHLTPEDVRDAYAATYPELATARIAGPEIQDGKQIYTFETSAGSKG